MLSPQLSAQAYDTTIMEAPQVSQVDSVVEENIVEETDNTEQTSADFKSLDPADSLSINLRLLPDSIVLKLKEDDDFWYANADIQKKEKKKKVSSYDPIGQKPWFKTLIWLIIIVVFAFILVFYLAESNIGLFRRNKSVNKESEHAEEEMPADIFAIHYQKEIEKAESRGDFRMAVRLQFLRLLKELAEKNILRYQQDRTNMDYLLQVYNTTYYKDFFRITRHYEYSWYGQFPVSQEMYSVIRNDIYALENKS